jgi:mevalonate kinase
MTTTAPNRARVLAPGKIILSGEHAVVHGQPALVLAVDRYAEALAASEDTPRLFVELSDLGLRREFGTADLARTSVRLKERYQRFLAGELPVGEILQDAFEPIVFAAALLGEQDTAEPAVGMSIQLRSELPIGCGMGSSAAAAVSVLRAMGEAAGMAATREALYRMTMEVEKLQHGRPSGVDPYVSTHGGFIRFRKGAAEERLAAPSQALFLVDTGAPQSTTGECVMQVTEKFGHSDVWEAFEATTHSIERAFVEGDAQSLRSGVRENHRLLQRIGVVPQAVARFVADVESSGGAAKVCGAGAIAGDRAGVLWVLPDVAPAGLCREYGYRAMRIKADTQGVRAAR